MKQLIEAVKNLNKELADIFVNNTVQGGIKTLLGLFFPEIRQDALDESNPKFHWLLKFF